MERNGIRNVLIAMVVVAVMAAGADAFAGKGYGKWGNGSQGSGPGACYAAGNLSEADIQKLESARQAFFEATAELRQQIREKRAAMRYEMVKKAPDAAVVVQIQKELSALQARLDEKRVAHMIEMKKINPDAGAGWMAQGRGAGRGWRHGGPAGRGIGPGGCW